MFVNKFEWLIPVFVDYQAKFSVFPLLVFTEALIFGFILIMIFCIQSQTLILKHVELTKFQSYPVRSVDITQQQVA